MNARDERGAWTRAAASLALSLVLAMGGVPSPALAEAREEAGAAVQAVSKGANASGIESASGMTSESDAGGFGAATGTTSGATAGIAADDGAFGAQGTSAQGLDVGEEPAAGNPAGGESTNVSSADANTAEDLAAEDLVAEDPAATNSAATSPAATAEETASEILALVGEDASAANIVRALAERLSADELLATSEDVARAFAATAQALDLACLVVHSEGDTWWNMVEVEGAWYHVDAAWQGETPIDLVGDETLRSIDPVRATWTTSDEEEAPVAGADYAKAEDPATEESQQADSKQAGSQQADSKEGPEAAERAVAEPTNKEGSQGADQGQGQGDPIQIAEADVIKIADQTYTGSQIKPDVVVMHDGTQLVLDTDYTVTYGENVRVGEGTVTVEAQGLYAGKVTATFKIVAVSLKDVAIKLEKTSYAYTGAVIKPKVLSVTLNGTKLKEGTDYKAPAYASNKNVGTATVTITGIGNYKDTAKTTFKITPLSVSKASVTGINAQYAWTGSQIKPVPTVKLGGKTLKRNTDYTLTYGANKAVGTGTVTIAAKKGSNYTGSVRKSFKIVQPAVAYRTYMQTYAWQAYSKDGETNGVTGQSKRVEALQVKLGKGFPVAGGVTYRTHVQSVGWTDWANDGQKSGTTGQSKRVEAVQIKLTGDMAKKYNVYYRTHVQNVGWTAWAANGQVSGSTGMSWRVEALQVKLVRKGQAAPKASGSNTTLKVVSNPGVTYHAHVQDRGWLDWVKNGRTAGTTGQSLRVEATEMKLGNNKIPGSITYAAHVQGKGWVDVSRDGETNGSLGESRRLEAMRVLLKGEVAKYFDVYYRAHVQGAGWLGWAKNSHDAGSVGAGKRMEAFEVRLVPKGAAAPGSTENPVVNNDWFVRKAEEERMRIMQADPMYQYAQGFSSPTGWLILVDCTTCNTAIFSGSRGNWYMRDKYLVGVGRYTSPSRHGVWSIGGRGYSFGGSDYTCYYWVSYYNDYLFHTVPCWAGTFDIKDPRLGEHVSAGCVRQPFDKAKWLYDNIPAGTTVVVYDA
ncbi:MAG: L,D-transpeptidase family protein [Atopobiaceae bacterium]|nr:L,D-transpeptidase family protein [Atopobiaceae bacterium]